MHSVYKIEAASGTITDAKFGAYWKNGIGNLARENIISGIAFSAPYDVSNSDINSVDQDLALAIATLKVTYFVFFSFCQLKANRNLFSLLN